MFSKFGPRSREGIGNSTSEMRRIRRDTAETRGTTGETAEARSSQSWRSEISSFFAPLRFHRHSVWLWLRRAVNHQIQCATATSSLRPGTEAVEKTARNALRLPAICQVQSRPL